MIFLSHQDVAFIKHVHFSCIQMRLPLPIHHCFSTPLLCLSVYSSSPPCLIICFTFLSRCSPFLSAYCFSNESGTVLLQFTSVLFSIHLTEAPSASVFFQWAHHSLTPLPFLSLTGWASGDFGLTFQLHFDLWPCCCKLLHLSHNSICFSLTSHPLSSASHPLFTTLSVFSLSFVRHIPWLYRLLSECTLFFSLYILWRDVGEEGESGAL